MKRVLSVMLLAVLMLTIVGCNGGSMDFGGNLFGKQQQDEMVESYRYAAQAMIDIGNYEEAVKILQEGMEQTGSEELNKMLASVNQKLQEQDIADTQDALPTDPVAADPPATEAPPQKHLQSPWRPNRNRQRLIFPEYRDGSMYF